MQLQMLRMLAEQFGKRFEIEPALILAMIEVESSGRHFATQFEPETNQYLLMTRNWAQRTNVSEDTERVGQKTSWGLMQVMGFRARELGFKGLFPELTEPSVGIEYGCLALKNCQKRFGTPGVLGFQERVIAAYNAGSPRDKNGDGRLDNWEYVQKVMGPKLMKIGFARATLVEPAVARHLKVVA